MSVYTKTIPSRFYSSRGGSKPRLLILHTAEGSLNVTSLGGWFNNPSANASSHAGIDDQDVALFVPEQYSAWTARNANPVAVQAELCGFAAWTPDDWAKHPGMVENAARWLAYESTLTGIPLVRLRGGETRNGTGVCMHVDITNGWGIGSHQDCGPHFPIDAVLERARQIQSGDDDVLKDQTINNPVSGKPETLDVTIAYMEQRIVTSILNQLPGAIWNYLIANPIAGAKETAGTALSYLEARITGRPTK